MDDTIEKAIAAAVSVVFDDIFDLKDQIEKIERTPGPKGEAGETPPIRQVCEYLLENYPDAMRGEKGADGAPGKNALAPSANEIANHLKSDPAFMRNLKPTVDVKDVALALLAHGADELRGPAGKDAPQFTVEDVTRALKADAEFLASTKGEEPDIDIVVETLFKWYGERLRGEPGKDAPQITLDEVTSALKADAEFVATTKGEKGDTPSVDEVVDLFFQKYGDRVRGEPGKDAQPILLDDISAALKADADFVTKAKGDRGEKGEKGEKGDPGEAPAAEEIVDAIFEKYQDKMRGERGESVELEAVLKSFKADTDFIASLKGAQGEKGETGEAGAGIEAPRWKKGVYRDGVTVQHFGGRYYRAIRDTADEPGISADWERVGSAGFRFVGDGESIDKALLEDGDIFTGRGSSYFWFDGKAHLLAAIGETGAAGKDGQAGQPGKDAPTIVAGELNGKSLVLAMSDGSLVDCDSTSFVANIEKTILQVHQAALEDERLKMERRGTPMDVFCGSWMESRQYKRGDVVTFSNALWTCKAAEATGRFNPDDWHRALAMPASKQKTKVAITSNVSRIPARKKPGSNLRSCNDIVTDGELNQYEIQVWHESEVIMPVIRLCTFDPTMLARQKHVNVEAIHIHNYSKGLVSTDADRKALLDDVGFALTADTVAINSKLISTVSIDRRNPDFDLVSIDSRYRNASGDMMRYSVSAWTDKENPFSFIGFGADGDEGSHWRAFHK